MVKRNTFFLVTFFDLLLFFSCSLSYPTYNKIDATSDGSYVVETGMSDAEILSYGQTVIYRFQSVPNMVAVKNVDLGNQKHHDIYDTGIYQLPLQNVKKRLSFSNSQKSFKPPENCDSAYCEAHFDQVLSEINFNNVFLERVKVAIVDSGIYPATDQIKNHLISSINISGDQNSNNWSSHATYIASLLSGLTKNGNVTNIYAKNADLYSIKITFSADLGDQSQKKYGSMQLAVALDQAVFSGAKIVNLSSTYTQEPDPNVEMAEKIVISNAAKKGILFVVAAGNNGNNLKKIPAFPASYDLNNIITVASHDSHLVKAIYSNYGSFVDLSAQGESIELNNKSGGIDNVSGTSFAVPIVVSALSLYYGLFPNADMDLVLKHLFSSANAGYRNLNLISDDKISNYGRLDTKAFIEMGRGY